MKYYKFITAVFSFVFLMRASAQDVLLQAWYWDYPKTISGAIWADTLRLKAQALKDAGFTYVWLPPLSRSSSGPYSNGYDPKDLYDLGQYGQGATGVGTRANVDAMIAAFTTVGVKTVADVVYNHRDGGAAEKNDAVAGWVKNFSSTKIEAGDNCYPSDRFRCVLPIGGSTGRGAGTYYIKIRSASRHANYYGKQYKVYVWTNTKGWQGKADMAESEPNGGGDCSEANNSIELGRNMIASIDYGGCGTDEFALTLSASEFAASGDALYFDISNSNSNFSDHYIYGLWYEPGSTDVAAAIEFQTYTDFTHMPSGRGAMNYLNFKPNGNATHLSGDWDWMWFYYDYDQNVQATKDSLSVWSRWLWTNVGIRGYRMDAVKHFDPSFVATIMNNLHDNGIDPGLVVGEYYDYNPTLLKSWVNSVTAAMSTATKAVITPRVFDFSLRQALKDACDSYGYDVRNVFSSGIVDGAGGSGFNTVTFVSNHDFRSVGQYVANDPILAYAYILTNNQAGMPCVYYSDYMTMKVKIDTLMSAHKKYIYGASQRDYLSRAGTPYTQTLTSGVSTTTLIYQLRETPSKRDVIVAINFAGVPLIIDQGINMASVREGTIFTDVIGNAIVPTTTVGAPHTVHIELPARSYSVWVADRALPVELESFMGKRTRGIVELRWKTATEIENYGFNVERKQPAAEGVNAAWESIGFIAGQGTSNSPHEYTFTDKIGTTCLYRLKQVDVDGTFTYSQEISVGGAKRSYMLTQNFPNPCNPATSVFYELPEASIVDVKLYDVTGRMVGQLDGGLKDAGTHRVDVDVSTLASGIYMYQLRAGAYCATHKMCVIK